MYKPEIILLTVGIVVITVTSATITYLVYSNYSNKKELDELKNILEHKYRKEANEKIEKKIEDDLNVIMGALGKEIKKLGGEVHRAVGEIKQIRVLLAEVRSKSMSMKEDENKIEMLQEGYLVVEEDIDKLRKDIENKFDNIEREIKGKIEDEHLYSRKREKS